MIGLLSKSLKYSHFFVYLSSNALYSLTIVRKLLTLSPVLLSFVLITSINLLISSYFLLFIKMVILPICLPKHSYIYFKLLRNLTKWCCSRFFKFVFFWHTFISLIISFPEFKQIYWFFSIKVFKYSVLVAMFRFISEIFLAN